MENDQNSEIANNTPVKEMTRREMLWFGVLGGGCALTGLHVRVQRRSRSRNPLGITEIIIKGPFERYGVFRKEDLMSRYSVKAVADFEWLALGFSQGTYYDSVGISFTFAGEENPNRKMKVSFRVYGADGEVIGGTTQIFDDPRIAAREWNSTGSMFFMEPTASLRTRLGTEKDRSHVSRIEIVSSSMYNSR